MSGRILQASTHTHRRASCGKMAPSEHAARVQQLESTLAMLAEAAEKSAEA
jgi:hypothetical protein